MDISVITGQGQPIEAADRATDAWAHILEKPTSIVLVRGKNTTLAAQTVRIEFTSTTRGTEVDGEGGGQSANQSVVIFGVRDHPTIPDTNIERDDRFSDNGIFYRVSDVVRTIGQIQANADANQ